MVVFFPLPVILLGMWYNFRKCNLKSAEDFSECFPSRERKKELHGRKQPLFFYSTWLMYPRCDAWSSGSHSTMMRLQDGGQSLYTEDGRGERQKEYGSLKTVLICCIHQPRTTYLWIYCLVNNKSLPLGCMIHESRVLFWFFFFFFFCLI